MRRLPRAARKSRYPKPTYLERKTSPNASSKASTVWYDREPESGWYFVYHCRKINTETCRAGWLSANVTESSPALPSDRNLSEYSCSRSRSPAASSRASIVMIRPDELHVLVRKVWHTLRGAKTASSLRSQDANTSAVAPSGPSERIRLPYTVSRCPAL